MKLGITGLSYPSHPSHLCGNILCRMIKPCIKWVLITPPSQRFRICFKLSTSFSTWRQRVHTCHVSRALSKRSKPWFLTFNAPRSNRPRINFRSLETYARSLLRLPQKFLWRSRLLKRGTQNHFTRKADDSYLKRRQLGETSSILANWRIEVCLGEAYRFCSLVQRTRLWIQARPRRENNWPGTDARASVAWVQMDWFHGQLPMCRPRGRQIWCRTIPLIT